MKDKDVAAREFAVFTNNNISGCGCSSDSSCDTGAKVLLSADPVAITVTIDGKRVETNTHEKNLVETAKKAGIVIPAPCYRAERKKGCCHGCLVEENGEHKYACTIRPTEGMKITVDRIDLKEKRKQNILKYNEAIKKSNFLKWSE